MSNTIVGKMLQKFEAMESSYGDSIEADPKIMKKVDSLFRKGGDLKIKGIDFGTIKNRGQSVMYTPVTGGKGLELKNVEKLYEHLYNLIESVMNDPDDLSDSEYEKLGGEDMDLNMEDYFK